MSKQDKSARVPQREKLHGALNIKDLKWTQKQIDFINLALDKNVKILLISGPAGTSKTLLSVYCALKLLNEKKISDIVYIRSAVESSDAKIGFLPGDAEEKLHYFNIPFHDKLEELLNKSDVDRLQKEARISHYPVNYSRGLSWNAKAILVDESQNSSIKEIITVMTRLGQFCKCFIMADPSQTDLPQGKVGGFEKLKSIFNNEQSRAQGIYTFEFTEEDIVRSELVKFLVKQLKQFNINLGV